MNIKIGGFVSMPKQIGQKHVIWCFSDRMWLRRYAGIPICLFVMIKVYHIGLVVTVTMNMICGVGSEIEN